MPENRIPNILYHYNKLKDRTY